MDEEASDEDDVHDGMPVQGSATGDVDPEPQAPMGTHGKSQAVSHGHPPQEPSTATGEATEKPSTAMVNEPREEPSPVTELRRAQLPKATVEMKSVKIPVKIADEPEGVSQKTPAKDRLVEEMKKIQTHDPNVVPMQGGGYAPRGRF